MKATKLRKLHFTFSFSIVILFSNKTLSFRKCTLRETLHFPECFCPKRNLFRGNYFMIILTIDVTSRLTDVCNFIMNCFVACYIELISSIFILQNKTLINNKINNIQQNYSFSYDNI